LKQQSQISYWFSPILILISIFFWVARTFWIGLPYNTDGFGAPGNAIYAIVLVLLVLLLAAGLGSKILRLISGFNWTNTEFFCLSITFGLGFLAYLIFGLGLIGLLQPIHFLCLVIIIVIAIRNEFTFIVDRFTQLAGNISIEWHKAGFGKRILVIIGSCIFLLTLLQSLTPPFNYDALMYHLQGPRLFLEAGRIMPIFENWLTFYPFTGEMINLFGLAFGSDIFARLIHFSSLILTTASTYSLAARLLPRNGGALSVAIFTGIPVLFLWGSQANNDLTLVLYQFLAVFLFLLWIQKRQTGLLVLSGIMLGLALGSKYLAFSGLAILGMAIIIYYWDNSSKKLDLSKSFRDCAILCGTAILVASPWYLKNYLWTGNPIFPFYLPNQFVDPVQLSLWTGYMGRYGTGKQWFDYLLLPVNLFLRTGTFSTWFGVIDIPSPLFVLVFLYPFTIRKFSNENKKALHFLAFITFMQFIVWAAGSQQTRFLFPIYPGLSILACCFLLWLCEKKPYGQKIVFSLNAIFLLISLIIVSAAFSSVNPIKLLTERETNKEFLGRTLSDYPAMQFIQSRLPEESRVLMLWDGQSYYCDARCIPDLFQSQWTAFYKENPTVSSMHDQLASKKITHLMINQSDTSFFAAHDVESQNTQALHFLTTDFAPKCTETVFQENSVTIFELSTNLATCH
jgi:4-amino-4-deoxy-L-arabinose transferase-like glycosyltransferase